MNKFPLLFLSINLLLLGLSTISGKVCLAASPLMKTTQWLDRKMSINCEHRELQHILQGISNKLDINILYSAELAKIKKDCNYRDSTIENILSRLFADYNKSLMIDISSKTITVQSFGVSEYITASKIDSSRIQSFPSLGKIVNEELQSMQKEQYQKLRIKFNDNNFIVPGVNIPRGELISLQEKQHDLFEKEMADPRTVVPGAGISIAELKRLHENQLKTLKEDKTFHFTLP